ncbi:katanin p60 ATPase-containing subunit A-like 2 isoform X3 [Coregonus clupeaformis]|uniref:katanin p60 ATPase-containing subunit A-like 2 isoform X3 n=1 Tax=Coregonus clupeaformis TaxID=59861 RepID=UPI001E1C3D44|nr:katanin p60 ATPase-containing subunit A-like 2 isoform X3 [Coregonus clupeaformis]
MELSYQSIKTANQAREADEMRTESRRRNLLILIFHHLMEAGYMDAASALEQETNVVLRQFEVCDNIDLDTVLMEYESYYFIKFQRYPKLTKKLPQPVESRHARSCGKKRAPCTGVQPLPRINSSHRPFSRGGVKKIEPKMVVKDASKAVGENGGRSSPPEPTEFGLNVSPIIRNDAGEGGGQMKKGQLIDYRGLIQDASNSLSDPMERLLKPLSAFSGMNSEMRDLAAVISRDIYLHNPAVRWDDIIGLQAAKRLVKEAVVYPVKYPQLFTGILSPWKGLLLYGPPGTGKTLLAKAVATECNTTFFNISASSIVSKWRGDSEKLVRVLFELARYHAPSTIFLDELESVMSQRGTGGGGEHEGSRRMKTELLVQMDGLARSDDVVFVLAASNLPWELDHAMLRRLEKRILVGLPSGPARQAMVSHWLPPLSCTGGVELRTELAYETLAQATEGYSGSDIRLVCKETAMRPVRKIFDALESHQQGKETAMRPVRKIFDALESHQQGKETAMRPVRKIFDALESHQQGKETAMRPVRKIFDALESHQQGKETAMRPVRKIFDALESHQQGKETAMRPVRKIFDALESHQQGKETAMRPVRKIFDALESHQQESCKMPVIHLETVTTEDFLEVIAHTKPSARNLTDKYTAWEREYESV